MYATLTQALAAEHARGLRDRAAADERARQARQARRRQRARRSVVRHATVAVQHV
jgi:hypothetical protein